MKNKGILEEINESTKGTMQEKVEMLNKSLPKITQIAYKVINKELNK